MSNIHEQFKAFATASLRIGATMLEALTAEQRDQIDGAMQAGARLALELSPLPAFEHLQLMLVEREGARHVVATVALNKGD